MLATLTKWDPAIVNQAVHESLRVVLGKHLFKRIGALVMQVAHAESNFRPAIIYQKRTEQ